MYQDIKNSIKSSWYIAIILAVLTILVFSVGTIYFNNYKKQYYSEIAARLASIGELKITEIRQWRHERLNDGYIFLKNKVFAQNVYRYLADTNDIDAKIRIENWMQQILTGNTYSSIYLSDMNMNQRLIAGEPNHTKKINVSNDNLDSLRNGSVVFEDFFIDPDKGIVLKVMAPVMSSKNELVAIVSLRIDPYKYLYPFISRWPGTEKSPETLIVRREGDSVVSLNELKHLKGSALSFKLPLTDTIVPAVAAINGAKGILEGLDYRRSPVMAYVSDIPDSPWFIVARMDKEEIDEPLDARWRDMLVTIVLLLLFIVASFGMWWRQRRANYYKSSYESEKERTWLYDIVSRSLNEIYVFRTSDFRFIFINDGAVLNIGYSLGELMEMTPYDIKPLISKKEFFELVEPLISGGMDQLVFETVHQRKDGSQYDVEVHLQLVDLGNEKVFLAIINDITSKNQVLHALMKSERDISITLNSIGDGVIATDEHGMITRMNPVAEKMCGWQFADAVGQPLSDVFRIVNAETRATVTNPVELVIRHGKVVGLANHTILISRHGTEYQIADSAAPIKDQDGFLIGIVLVFSDVTEKYAIQQSLEKSEEQYRTIVSTMEQGLAFHKIICDDQGKPIDYITLEMNDSFARLTGLSREQLIGNRIMDVLPDLEPYWVEVLGRVALTGEPIKYDNYAAFAGRYFESVAYCPKPEHFAVITNDVTDRTLAQQAIKKSENDLAITLNSIADGVIATDEEGIVLRMNPVAESLTGYSSTEAIGKSLNSVFRVIISGTRELQASPVDLVLKSGKVVELSNHTLLVSKDGSEHQISDTAAPIKNDNGEIVGVVLVFSDVSEKYAIAEALRKSEDQYKRLVANITDLLCEIDEDGRYIYLSGKYYEVLGYHNDEMLGERAIDFISPDDMPKALKRYAEVSDEFGNSTDIWHFRHKDGSYRTFECRASFYPTRDGKSRAVIIAQDISERLRAEQELTIQRNTLNAIFQSSPYIMLLVDSEARLVNINRMGESFSGKAKVDLVGTLAGSVYNCAISFKGDGCGKNDQCHTCPIRNAVRTTLSEKTPISNQETEITILRSGIETQLNLYVSTNLVEQMGSDLVLLTIVDITDQKKSEKELILAKEKAEESDRLKSAFLANMSHEIRTPMNGIIGFSNLISDGELSTVERIEIAGILNKSANRLLELINNIIDISKLEVGQMEITEKEFNLNNLIDELYNFFSVLAAGKSLEFSIANDQPREDLMILSDERKIYQILTNLLGNAFKFTTSGNVCFGYSIKGANIEFFVRDTGVGISDVFLQNMFKRFAQEELAENRQHEGAGLGLSISKGLVNLLGGQIRVESQKGVGSTFSFTIPFKRVKMMEISSQTSTANPRANNISSLILVAEDEEINYLLLERILKRETNAKLIRAENGIRAIEQFNKHKGISLVIMDLKMPEMDGITATKRIREIDKKIPIVAVTAYALAGDKERALAAGCNDYLSKPFEVPALLKILNKWVA